MKPAGRAAQRKYSVFARRKVIRFPSTVAKIGALASHIIMRAAGSVEIIVRCAKTLYLIQKVVSSHQMVRIRTDFCKERSHDLWRRYPNESLEWIFSTSKSMITSSAALPNFQRTIAEATTQPALHSALHETFLLRQLREPAPPYPRFQSRNVVDVALA